MLNSNFNLIFINMATTFEKKLQSPIKAYSNCHIGKPGGGGKSGLSGNTGYGWEKFLCAAAKWEDGFGHLS